MSVPDEPPTDQFIYSILITYSYTCRGRRYAEGCPLPISVRDITDVVTAHPISISRNILDSAIFAIDDIVLSEHKENQNRQQEKHN